MVAAYGWAWAFVVSVIVLILVPVQVRSLQPAIRRGEFRNTEVRAFFAAWAATAIAVVFLGTAATTMHGVSGCAATLGLLCLVVVLFAWVWWGEGASMLARYTSAFLLPSVPVRTVRYVVAAVALLTGAIFALEIFLCIKQLAV